MTLFFGTEVAGSEPGRVDEDAARFDVNARAVAADVEDAIGLACGFVAGPGGPRVDADAREGFLLVNVLGRHVGEAAPAPMAAAATVSMASARRCSFGAASMRVVPTRE